MNAGATTAARRASGKRGGVAGAAGGLPALMLLLIASSCSNLPVGPAGASAGARRAVTFADWTPNGYATPAAVASLERLSATGATDVVFIITAYQHDIHANECALDPTRSPRTDALRSIAARARSLGLRPSLKLHVESDDGAWRALIEPSDPAAWFASYGAALDGVIDLSNEIGADEVVIGTELAGTLANEGAWRSLIARGRERFGGRLIYAASWDEADLVPFWDALDAIGVDFYYPVAARADAGRFELLAGWQAPLERLHALSLRAAKPVVLTEIGYRDIDGAGIRPWDYRGAARTDAAEQADLYWAALEAVADAPWIEGLAWWYWPANPAASTDGYSPIGKPAEGELTRSWKR